MGLRQQNSIGSLRVLVLVLVLLLLPTHDLLLLHRLCKVRRLDSPGTSLASVLQGQSWSFFFLYGCGLLFC